MAAHVGIVIVGTDPDKRLVQRHVTHGAVDPGNILKKIIDVAANDLSASNPTTTVFLVREALTFEEFYIVIINSHHNSSCLIDIHID